MSEKPTKKGSPTLDGFIEKMISPSGFLTNKDINDFTQDELETLILCDGLAKMSFYYHVKISYGDTKKGLNRYLDQSYQFAKKYN